MSDDSHWQGVYTTKDADGVSWFRPRLDESLRLIGVAALPTDARIVDVGGGASTLVDDLLDAGFTNLAVVDLADAALDVARARLNERARQVDWRVGDATTPLWADASVDLWHDRAVFHFMTTTAQRTAYVREVRRCVPAGGHVVVATFGPDGPERCSGLVVQRYDVDALAAAFGEGFEKVDEASERHVTPWGAAQSFVYCLLRRA